VGQHRRSSHGGILACDEHLGDDNVPLAGGAFRQLIVDLYRKDKLMRGELMIRGQRVDLSRIHANLLTVIAEDDHITPSVPI